MPRQKSYPQGPPPIDQRSVDELAEALSTYTWVGPDGPITQDDIENDEDMRMTLKPGFWLFWLYKEIRWSWKLTRLTGKQLLVGLTFYRPEHAQPYYHATMGATVRKRTRGAVELERFDGSLFRLPWNRFALVPAGSNTYRDDLTGRIFEHPHYIYRFQVLVEKQADIDAMMKAGFTDHRLYNWPDKMPGFQATFLWRLPPPPPELENDR